MYYSVWLALDAIMQAKYTGSISYDDKAIASSISSGTVASALAIAFGLDSKCSKYIADVIGDTSGSIIYDFNKHSDIWDSMTTEEQNAVIKKC